MLGQVKLFGMTEEERACLTRAGQVSFESHGHGAGMSDLPGHTTTTATWFVKLRCCHAFSCRHQTPARHHPARQRCGRDVDMLILLQALSITCQTAYLQEAPHPVCTYASSPFSGSSLHKR